MAGKFVVGCDLEGQVTTWSLQQTTTGPMGESAPAVAPLHVIQPRMSPYVGQEPSEKRSVTVVTAHADAFQIAVLLYYNSQSSYYLRVLDFLTEPDGSGGSGWHEKKTRAGRKRRIVGAS